MPGAINVKACMADIRVSIRLKHTCTLLRFPVQGGCPLLVAMQFECTLCFLFRQVWANVQYLTDLGAAQKLRFKNISMPEHKHLGVLRCASSLHPELSDMTSHLSGLFAFLVLLQHALLQRNTLCDDVFLCIS